MNMSACGADQDTLYAQAAEAFGNAIARLARGYEANPEVARDLEQDIHVALWRSFAQFRGDASLSTWVWRVAHNTGARHVEAQSRAKRSGALVPLEAIEAAPQTPSPEAVVGESITLERLYALIYRLRPTDRQVMLLYLEALEAREIGEITGLSPRAVATRVHRIKALLVQQFENDGEGRNV
ncbi:RNA polymerase sigma factor [Pelagibacterium xiamenense]|uniref:RNA polymerase sigma factor n=1 Tax=Pelagibacterium xiamenense TaxID=2901140 RepID=UPI001E6142F8|nr:sigma-70 family RNA polymerase sigma factor [Pelagibacterium xiamenense]MCD7058809.1 sigma-70 family RNA polymerase sigma factor [Pelagibacterium xiamenense]